MRLLVQKVLRIPRRRQKSINPRRSWHLSEHGGCATACGTPRRPPLLLGAFLKVAHKYVQAFKYM